MEYCSLCGGKYVEGKSQPWLCSSCGNEHYLVSSPCAELAIFNNAGEVLLAKRGINPNKGKYDLPGGFLILDETVESGLAREISEELGLRVNDYSNPVLVSSWTAGGYKFSKEELHTITFTFASMLLNDKEILPQDDVAELEFVSLDKLDSVNFSYPRYREIIKKAHSLLFD